MEAEGQTGRNQLDEMPEHQIFELLKKYHYTLTTAESATGGMIASTLINVPGISAFFTEGYVTYSNAAKVKMIHVNPETIERYGVVSAETAADMAVSAARTADTDAALSVTGVLVLFIGHFLPSFTFRFFMNNYIITHVFLFVKKPVNDSSTA